MNGTAFASHDWRRLPDALAGAVEAAFGLPPASVSPGDHPALAWRRSGLMSVTGRPDGPPLIAPVALTTLADSALSMLSAASPRLGIASGARLLGERARLMNLARGGTVSANGSCRLLRCADGVIALNLPREDDWELICALLSGQLAEDWAALAEAVLPLPAGPLVERARLLGLACAQVRPPHERPPFRVTRFGNSRGGSAVPLVVDLSSLWAGPLAGSLLAAAGARVVKVQSTHRPDGARDGHAGFYALLNRDKTEQWLDLRSASGQRALQELVSQADIVIEGSRPRALRQMGIDARDVAAAGATWISITAYGRDDPCGEMIGFGDDAAIAGGVGHRMDAVWGTPMFAGDAIADPLTGILAALLGWTAWRSGQGSLIDVALADVVAFACRFGARSRSEALAWQRIAAEDDAPLYALRA